MEIENLSIMFSLKLEKDNAAPLNIIIHIYSTFLGGMQVEGSFC